MSDTDEAMYGPILPEKPKDTSKEHSPINNTSETDEAVYGPILPGNSKDNSKEHSPIKDTYGPSLPPHLQKSGKSTEVCIGPTLPPHLRDLLSQQKTDEVQQESSEEEEVYGPVLPGQDGKTRAQIALEERALEIKLNKLNPVEQKVDREEWMTELPTVSASKLGLGPRQFRPNAGPDMSDRSSWTDTPNSKKKKHAIVDLKEERERLDLKKRDKEQEKMSKAHKRESKSLLELHKKKMKKETGEASTERKPFNRETDLQVNKFDEAQKASVLKKAQLLDDRFSQGKAKFL